MTGLLQFAVFVLNDAASPALMVAAPRFFLEVARVTVETGATFASVQSDAATSVFAGLRTPAELAPGAVELAAADTDRVPTRAAVEASVLAQPGGGALLLESDAKRTSPQRSARQRAQHEAQAERRHSSHVARTRQEHREDCSPVGNEASCCYGDARIVEQRLIKG